ncbi:MAG: bifunctional metallophosphatase/5'-nucleotidase [Candidatus Cloacimonetes bacterium]|jgi:2',3'-cyclic-nucleotide 2'-phosphodiesterase (5'-nucleotidase family)|nr:bifunctional metallophosphatase/5'-nucleotidase [Candidatus Cloacimonadota bacterium]NLO44440.1 bifunctional metallophosphatase/5'-nucleotidase [Candidatus Cloacimonadota bacterium]
MKARLFLITLISIFLFACSQNLRILHTNDSHAAYEPHYDGIGGYLALEYHLDQERSRTDKHLYLDAGDMQTGSIFSSLEYQGLRGGAILEVFDRLDLDASTLGNHEFDISYEHAEALVQDSAFPVLSANLLTEEGESFGTEAYKVFKRGKTKIGVLGLTVDNLPLRVKPENVEPLTILPYLEALERFLPKLRAESDIVVLLTHNGWKADSLLATQIPEGVDMIIGGHSHTAIDSPVNINNIYIASAGSHLRYLGEIDLKIKRGKIVKYESRLIPLTQAPEDYESELKDFLHQVIGEMEREMSKPAGILPFDFEVNKFALTKGTSWIANAINEEYPSAQLAMINNGGLRKNLLAGEISLRELHEYIPFGNTVVCFNLYGRDITDAEELNRQLLIDKPHDIMTLNIPGWLVPGEILTIAGKEIVPEQVYRVVSHDYILSQWDKYIGSKPFDIEETGNLFLDGIINQVGKTLK